MFIEQMILYYKKYILLLSDLIQSNVIMFVLFVIGNCINCRFFNK